MKQLKIDEKEALKLYKDASKEFKIVLENTFGKEYFNQDITDKVHDIDSLCEFLEIDEDELFIFPKNTKNKHERMINACNILPKIAEVYNEGVVLDWDNTNQYKYLPYLSFSGSFRAVVHSYVWHCLLGSPVGFAHKSSDNSLKAYKNFKSYFEDFWGKKETYK
jgi:hypothetical protein